MEFIMSKSLALRVIREEHSALSAMLHSMQLLIRQGPGSDPERFFATLCAMLFYICEYPERLHHPKETEWLFPAVARKSPAVARVVQRLDKDHASSERAVRELQHALQAWEFLGDGRRQEFVRAFESYRIAYQEHMMLEETEILPVAEELLGSEDWTAIDQAFAANRDPLTGRHPAEGIYRDLFRRIVHDAPEPIGFGA
jgi:hemerythrin-like domain-containing protein